MQVCRRRSVRDAADATRSAPRGKEASAPGEPSHEWKSGHPLPPPRPACLHRGVQPSGHTHGAMHDGGQTSVSATQRLGGRRQQTHTLGTPPAARMNPRGPAQGVSISPVLLSVFAEWDGPVLHRAPFSNQRPSTTPPVAPFHALDAILRDCSPWINVRSSPRASIQPCSAHTIPPFLSRHLSLPIPLPFRVPCPLASNTAVMRRHHDPSVSRRSQSPRPCSQGNRRRGPSFPPPPISPIPFSRDLLRSSDRMQGGKGIDAAAGVSRVDDVPPQALGNRPSRARRRNATALPRRRSARSHTRRSSLSLPSPPPSRSPSQPPPSEPRCGEGVGSSPSAPRNGRSCCPRGPHPSLPTRLSASPRASLGRCPSPTRPLRSDWKGGPPLTDYLAGPSGVGDNWRANADARIARWLNEAAATARSSSAAHDPRDHDGRYSGSLANSRAREAQDVAPVPAAAEGLTDNAPTAAPSSTTAADAYQSRRQHRLRDAATLWAGRWWRALQSLHHAESRAPVGVSPPGWPERPLPRHVAAAAATAAGCELAVDGGGSPPAASRNLGGSQRYLRRRTHCDGSAAVGRRRTSPDRAVLVWVADDTPGGDSHGELLRCAFVEFSHPPKRRHVLRHRRLRPLREVAAPISRG